jgi:hypothetical protein
MGKNRIRLFSKKDGTSFIEDIHTISDKTKLFLAGFPDHLKKWLYEATIIIDALQKLDDALQEGEPADKAIDFILGQIKGEADERLYEYVKESLHDFLGRLDDLAEKFGTDRRNGGEKKSESSLTLQTISGLSELESDTVIQNAVYIYKS